MAAEKSIIKKEIAEQKTFEFKPRDFSTKASDPARSFVDMDQQRSPDFKISELIAQQAGIAQLEKEAVKDKINSQVLEKIKTVQEAAYKEGHELGLIEGSEKAYKDSVEDLKARLKNMDLVFKNLEDLKNRLMVQNEAELIELVFLTAKKIALRDLTEHRDAVAEILRDVAAEMQADERISVRLNPEDLYFIETLQDKVGERLQNYERIKFVTDESVKLGGCLIDTAYGTVDATVDERVERTWQTLQTRIPRVPPPKKD